MDSPELISIIDTFLATSSKRSLITSTEVQNFLLDLRSLADVPELVGAV